MFQSLIVLGYLLASTYTDLKERIVPDILTYSLFFLGILFNLYLIFTSQLDIFLPLSALTLTLIFSLFLYKTGAWAGGDVKLFLTIAIWTPTNPCLLTACTQSPLFTFELFLVSAFLLLPFALFKAIWIFLTNKTKQQSSLSYLIPNIHSSLLYTPVIFATYYLSSILFKNPFPYILLLLYLFIPKQYKPVLSFLSLPFLFFNPLEFFYTLLSLILITLIFSFYTLSKTLLRTTKKVSQLKEGDITAQTYIKKGKKIIPVSLDFKKILKGDFSTLYPKNIFIAGFDANGLEKEQIKILKEKAKENLAPKTIPIKESAPFVPFVLAAYILLITLGNLISGVLL